MRIIKYLFLLLLLSAIALSIFIATQKGSFNIERSKIINSPKSSIYNYVNDYKNWREWNSLAVGDSLINIAYSSNTVGKGSSCSWDGNQGTGNLKTINTKENDSIVQTINFNGNDATITMSFKDTLGKTKVTWRAKGTMGFLYKALNAFNGGADELFGNMFENSLSVLDKKLDYEINTYSVNVNGVTNFKETHYLAQTFTSEFSKVNKNTAIVISKISLFCQNNNLTISGKPFVIYHTYDTTKELTKLSICIPIKDPIFLIEGSDISSKTLKSFEALKTTLQGDYSHTNKALDKSKEHIRANYISLDPTFSHIAIFTISKKDINIPSKWITEFYYPIRPKTVAKPAVVVPTESEVTTPTPSEEKEKNTEF